MVSAGQPPSSEARSKTWRLITGFITTQMVYVAVKLDLPDLLRQGARPASELASATGTNAQALQRLLRGLVNIGICVEEQEGSFGLSPAGIPLCEGPGSLRWMALLSGDLFYRSYGAMLDSIQTGDTAFEHVYEVGLFEHLSQHPAVGDTFGRLMGSFTTAKAQALAAAYDFAPFGVVADIGGGHGALLTEVLKAFPGTRGLLFDLPEVVGRARPQLEVSGMAARCTTTGGDFFQAVPTGADCYVLSWVLHDWADEESIRILRNVRAAIPAHGRLLIVETVMPERMTEGAVDLRTDIQMLIMTGGLERTEREYRQLLAAASFQLARVVPTAVEQSIIEALPI